ncbi:MAG: flagellar motor switch protein FliN [Thermodesulfobacteriota bacterium]|nr:flagellar motor switch protein FliN [Thermodesulfobacteriota bacterium]
MAEEEKASASGGAELSQNDIDSLLNPGSGGDAGVDAGKESGAQDESKGQGDQDNLAEEWAAALDSGEEIKEGEPLGAKAKAVKLEELGGSARSEETRDLDFILDIPLDVTVEIGRTKMLINDLLQLGQGSVIELDRLAGEPLDILVNNKLVARGEIVVVSEKFAIRITDVVSPMERVKRLG